MSAQIDLPVTRPRPGRASPHRRDTAVMGEALVARFRAAHAGGRLLPPERPAQLILQILAGDTTGEVIDINGPRGAGAARRSAPNLRIGRAS